MTPKELKDLKELQQDLKDRFDLSFIPLDSMIKKYDKKPIEERKQEFIINYKKVLIHQSDFNCEFVDYWTEHGENDRKMRFEKEKSFDISRRFKTWQRNSKKFNKPIKVDNKSINSIWHGAS